MDDGGKLSAGEITTETDGGRCHERKERVSEREESTKTEIKR